MPRELLLGAALTCSTAGELPGTPSTVLDLREYELSGALSVVREGALALADIERALA